jgi:dTMP kinase
MPAFVIAIEGPDFSGKSTIANLLVEILRKNNKDVFFKRTSAPSQLITGVFSKILRNSADNVSSEVFSLTYAADFLHKYETIIKPLKESKEKYIVIEDRCLLSTIIYQSIIGRTDLKWIKEINKFNKDFADMTIVLKLNIEEILKRSALEKKDFDKFETKKHLEDETIIYNNLTPEIMKEFNVRYVDANDDPEKIAKECANIIQKELDREKDIKNLFKT